MLAVTPSKSPWIVCSAWGSHAKGVHEDRPSQTYRQSWETNFKERAEYPIVLYGTGPNCRYGIACVCRHTP